MRTVCLSKKKTFSLMKVLEEAYLGKSTPREGVWNFLEMWMLELDLRLGSHGLLCAV